MSLFAGNPKAGVAILRYIYSSGKFYLELNVDRDVGRGIIFLPNVSDGSRRRI